MTESGRYLRYIPGISTVYLCAGLAAPASAQIGDTFAQFQARCLTPMAEVRESETQGLTLMASDAHREMWMADFRDWQMVVSTPDAVVQFCAIHGAFGTEVDDWVRQVLADGTYIPVPRADPADGVAPQTLQSTTWREPRIEVEIDRTSEPRSLTVIETVLES